MTRTRVRERAITLIKLASIVLRSPLPLPPVASSVKERERGENAPVNDRSRNIILGQFEPVRGLSADINLFSILSTL